MGDGEKVFRHPLVGTMTLAHESLELNRTHGQRLVIYMATPGSADHDAMVLLDMAGSADLGADPSGGASAPSRSAPPERPDLDLAEPGDGIP